MRFALAAMLASLAFGACGDDRELVGLTFDTPAVVDAVELPDLSRNGEPFAFRAAPGGLLVVYFGFTNCPDVCPTTMTDLRTALDGLGDDAARVDVAMVTVDPARDTDVLSGYVQSFVDDAHAVATDDDADLRRVAESFGVAYEVITAPDGTIQVGHTDYLFGVDDAGRLVISWPFGTPADDLEGDLAQLLGDEA